MEKNFILKILKERKKNKSSSDEFGLRAVSPLASYYLAVCHYLLYDYMLLLIVNCYLAL